MADGPLLKVVQKLRPFTLYICVTISNLVFIVQRKKEKLRKTQVFKNVIIFNNTVKHNFIMYYIRKKI